MSTEADPDVQLMLAVQRGETAAFERLFEKHIGAVVGFATQFVGSRARAEELAQDVFLQVYKTRARYLPRARFTTWLYRMVTNACLSEVRRADYHGRVQSLDQQAPGGDEPSVPREVPTRSSEDDMVSQEAVARMRTAVMGLPPQQRAALLLARVEGFPYDEVADSLDCSVSAVKSLIHRATVTLREAMREGGE